jgi:hypothetical protein
MRTSRRRKNSFSGMSESVRAERTKASAPEEGDRCHPTAALAKHWRRIRETTASTFSPGMRLPLAPRAAWRVQACPVDGRRVATAANGEFAKSFGWSGAVVDRTPHETKHDGFRAVAANTLFGTFPKGQSGKVSKTVNS